MLVMRTDEEVVQTVMTGGDSYEGEVEEIGDRWREESQKIKGVRERTENIREAADNRRRRARRVGRTRRTTPPREVQIAPFAQLGKHASQLRSHTLRY